MNICIITRTTLQHAMGGMEQHIRMLAEGLVRSGNTVTVVSTAHHDGIEVETIAGVVYHYLRGTRPGKYSAAFYKKSYAHICALHDTQPLDVIHSQSGGGFYLIKKGFSVRFHIPIVVTMHGIFYNELITRLGMVFSPGTIKERIKSFILVFYYMFIYLTRDVLIIPKADAVIATSIKQEKLIRKFYFLKDTLHTVFNGVDVVLPAEESGAKKDDAKVLLCIARLKQEKGIQVALEALPSIVAQSPRTKLVIVGDGEYRKTLEEMVNVLNVRDNVEFVGEIRYDELARYYSNADIFINSTLRENGYDLTIVQAMGYAKPVVVTELKSLEGVIDNHKNGIMVPMGKPVALARAVVDLLERPEVAAEMGRRAQRTFAHQFSADKMTENTMKVYSHVIQRGEK